MRACGDMGGNMRGKRSKRGTWWWIKEVKEAISRKKDAHSM